MKDIAVVTGAGGGIGRAIALKIHEGSSGDLRLALCDLHREAAEKVAKEIPESFVIQADIATAEGRGTLLSAVLDQGSPYVFVNNAGIDRPHEPALMVQEESFDKLMAVNLKGPVFLMKTFGKEMMGSGSGVIVNVTSVLAHHALTGSAFYRATKAGLEELTKQFAAELGPRGVRVNAVAPGFIQTPMTDGISQEIKDKIRSGIALNEFGTPEAVAEAVWHLIENPYLNGAVIPVDGGMRL